MEFRILGPLEVADGDGLVRLAGVKQRALLALLLLDANRVVSSDRLIDGLWGERPPGSAGHALQVYVSGLRKLLAPAGGEVEMRSSAGGYVLQVDPDRVDVSRFEGLIADGQGLLGDDPRRAREVFERALGLWRGAPLEEFSQFEFARGEAERLGELRTVALENLVEARLALGEHEPVLSLLTGLVAASPLRERPRRLLMLALYRSGRHAEALGVYRDACGALDEIGLQPGPELRQLEQAILNHDEALAPPLVSDGASEVESAERVSALTPGGPSRGLPVSGTVTMLFTDIEGSTGLGDRLGDRYPELLAGHHRLLREAIAAAGGHEVSTAGDSFFVAFTEADRALDCALRVQRSLAAASWPESEAVRVRVGIHTGAPALQDGTYVGVDAHCAARVMALAHGGQVLLTKATRDALGSSLEMIDLGHHRLKGLPDPVHLFQAVADDLPREFPVLRSLSNSNLPAALHTLIGRSGEVATALGLLARGDVRLVTLLGPGGAGKTRLALEIAGEAVARYRDGAWLVSLAPLTDPSLIASELAQTLGVRESGGRALELTVAGFLARRELLLVLDNFEHLLDGAGLISRLLEAAPGLDVLATSREALHVRGEHRMHVAPLAPSDAAELFIERASAVRADAIQDPDDRAAVDRICQRLDRLPLALELAAARVALFSIPALDTRLAERLDLPEGPRDLPDRQRTLQAAIDWSYQLLNPAEQALFRDLAVFADGARLDAIQAVHHNPDGDVIRTIAGLIDKSLLRRRDDPDGQPRFWLLETIRQHADERLTEEDATDEIANRHAMYYLDLAEEMEPRIPTSEQRITLDLLEADHDNLRAAFEHLTTSDPDGALRIAAALGFFWDIHGHHSEAREKLTRSLASPSAETSATAEANFFLGRGAVFRGERAEARPLLEQARRLAHKLALHRFEVLALTHLAHVAVLGGQRDRFIALSEEARRIARADSDDWTLRAALNALGHGMRVIGQRDRARPMLEEALALSRRFADPMATAQTAANLADLALEEGALEIAEALIAESLQHAREINYPVILAESLALDAQLALFHADLKRADARISECLQFVRASDHLGSATTLVAAIATLAAAREEPLRAAQLWAAEDSARARLGVSGDVGGSKRLRDKWLPQARKSTDTTAWQIAWDSGAKLTLHQALDLSVPHIGSST